MGEDTSSRCTAQGTRWARGLGEEHHGREELAGKTSKSRQEDAARATALSAERWAAIVTGIRRLVDAYNAGAERAVLSVEEASDEPTVTVAVGAEGPSLRAALDDTLICVHARDAGGVARVSEVRLRSDRGDDATAAYVLQNWMERL
jgi:hypothetical protein